MARPSVMLVCGRHPRHLHVANLICRFVDPVAIVQETGRRPRTYEQLRSKLRPGEIAGKVWRTIRDHRRYGDGREARYFFGGEPPRLDRPDLVEEVPHIDDPRVVDLARRQKPDIIAVMGSSLIKGELLTMGRLGIINLHGGINPHYRGSDGIFWALHRGEPDMAGCTLHFIDRGIDTGNIIAHVRPGVRSSDDEMSLLWRAFRDSAPVYVEALLRLARGERLGRPISGKGRLYLLRHRTLQREIELAVRLRRGLLRGVSLPPEVRWFSAADSVAVVPG